VNDAHRKRGEPDLDPVAEVGDEGPLVLAVRRALAAGEESFDVVQAAQAEQAIILAELVEGRGPAAVAASKELRAVLDAIAGRLDDEYADFIRLVSTPTSPGDPPP
jgi:hypothetical protein